MRRIIEDAMMTVSHLLPNLALAQIRRSTKSQNRSLGRRNMRMCRLGGSEKSCVSYINKIECENSWHYGWIVWLAAATAVVISQHTLPREHRRPSDDGASKTLR